MLPIQVLKDRDIVNGGAKARYEGDECERHRWPERGGAEEARTKAILRLLVEGTPYHKR
jgi:hypothetical protein